ncbi:hypothetical protein CROQUDRAFT_694377 [Cronartium quercuum f. sp. fusiforme G11]|uniref:GPI-anchored wall transfer protein n=1 Tax=Cronartium quercuum f. sp. fusiforme G11 TaxID=708437 RepID=A0A9P6NQG5_9BASI|nr:hypothetical protein CROQUDRAFT_694377 [Cronartium quercuum f. sp. fusiforme G11]
MDYKSTKETFISGGQGCSIVDVLAIALTALLTYFLWSLVESHLAVRRSLRSDSFVGLTFEFFLLTVPLLLAITLFAHGLWTLNAALALCSGVLYFSLNRLLASRPRRRSPLSSANDASSSHSDCSFSTRQLRSPVDSPYGYYPSSPSKLCPSRRTSSSTTNDLSRLSTSLKLQPTNEMSSSADDNARLEPDFRQGFVTLYRAQMMLLTVLSILAVDFPAFPRQFGKTESTGISLMDLGVGSFVFSLGIVSALPVLKRIRPHQSFWFDVWASGRKTAPLVMLGVVRTMLVKGVEYPEHITEYGVHWNFFFTLAVLPILNTSARRLMSANRLGFASLGLLLGSLHQLVLGYGGLERYVLSDAPRKGLLSANREGLASLAGYGVIYLFGLDTGCYVLPPDPGYLKKLERTASQPGKQTIVLASWAIVWWTLFGILGTPCRRTANAAYCAWVAAMNVSLLLGYQLLSRQGPIPRIYEAANANSLAVFLVGNLLTGLVNLSIETVYVTNKWASLAILEGYLAIVVGVAWIIRRHRLRL